MTRVSGFKITRTTIARRDGPLVDLPEHGDAERLHRLSNSLKELGSDRVAYVQEIGKLWTEANDRFLSIGRYLARAKERLPHGAFEAMIAADLPFGKHVARQFRMIAAAVDGGRVEEDELPQSYTTAYKLIEMKDDVFARARREGLIRPDVTRRDVAVFMRRLDEEAQGLRAPEERLEMERDVLRRRLKALGEEQREAKRRLSEIEAKLAGKVIDREIEEAAE